MIINAWLIKSTKSAANLTMSKWKGLTTGRQKRGKGLSNASQSVLDRQAAMGYLVNYFKLTAAAVKIGFKQYNSTIGNYAAWIREAMDNWVDFSTPGSPALQLQLAVFFKGSMPFTDMTTAVADDSANTLVVTYPTTVGYGQAATDRIRLVLYNITAPDTYVDVTSTATRADGTATFNIPSTFFTTGDSVMAKTAFEGQPSTQTAGKVSVQAEITTVVVA